MAAGALDPADKVAQRGITHGSRRMARPIGREGETVGRRRVRRLMRPMGPAAIYRKPRTGEPHPEHRIYRYLAREMAIVRPNQV